MFLPNERKVPCRVSWGTHSAMWVPLFTLEWLNSGIHTIGYPPVWTGTELIRNSCVLRKTPPLGWTWTCPKELLEAGADLEKQQLNIETNVTSCPWGHCCRCDQYPDKERCRGAESWFGLPSHVTCHHLEEIQVGTQATAHTHSQEQRGDTHGLDRLLMVWACSILPQFRASCPGDGAAHSGLGVPDSQDTLP